MCAHVPVSGTARTAVFRPFYTLAKICESETLAKCKSRLKSLAQICKSRASPELRAFLQKRTSPAERLRAPPAPSRGSYLGVTPPAGSLSLGTAHIGREHACTHSRANGREDDRQRRQDACESVARTHTRAEPRRAAAPARRHPRGHPAGRLSAPPRRRRRPP